MKDEGRAAGGLDTAHERAPQTALPLGSTLHLPAIRVPTARRPPVNHMPRLISATNNCRLRAATATRFALYDEFSRIIRLGEGRSTSGRTACGDRPRGSGGSRDLSRHDAQS